jgi:hypothetical protein
MHSQIVTIVVEPLPAIYKSLLIHCYARGDMQFLFEGADCVRRRCLNRVSFASHYIYR